MKEYVDGHQNDYLPTFKTQGEKDADARAKITSAKDFAQTRTTVQDMGEARWGSPSTGLQSSPC